MGGKAISVIIPTYCRRDALTDCIESLCEQAFPSDEYEVIVVDDASNDDTVKMLRDLKTPFKLTTVQQSRNAGQSAAKNAGARNATGRLLLFLDDDMRCDPGMLGAHAAAHANVAPNRVIFGAIKAAPQADETFSAEIMSRKLNEMDEKLSRDKCPSSFMDLWIGPNCSLPAVLFRQFGGFDEVRFPRRCEDAEFAMRLFKNGIEFRYEPRAVVWHRWVKSEHQMLREWEEDGRAAVSLCRLHPERSGTFPGLFQFFCGPKHRRLMAAILTSFPSLSDIPLAMIFALVGSNNTGNPFREMARRIYYRRCAIAMISGARREAGSWHELEQLFGRQIPVLMYHNVTPLPPVPGGHASPVSPGRFARHVRWLRYCGFRGVTAAHWLAFRSGRARMPPKPVIITFDDAYADIAEYALPVLGRHGFGATIFAITTNSAKQIPWEESKVMTMPQLRYWTQHGMEIGAHSRTHADLTRVTDGVLHDEVAGSKRDLEAADIEPVSFAYPYGYFDERVVKAVASSFSVAFIADQRGGEEQANPLLLRRIAVHGTDRAFDVLLHVCLGFNPLDRIRAVLRPRARLRSMYKLLERR